MKGQADPNKVKDLADALNIKTEIATLLVQRGISTFDEAKTFFRPSLENLPDPFLMKDMDKAISRIDIALRNNEKILVYGDYDVDGTTAVSLVYSFLSENFPLQLGYYIPDRYAEGYGISFKGIDFAEQENFSLIIALDCGIRSSDKIEYASNKGIDFIICDHHIPGEEIPRAFAVLDPKQKDCEYPYKELSGCGIGFKLIQALNTHHALNLDLTKYLDLVALSIAADIVPVTDENRTLAFFGLKRINEKPRPGIAALLDGGKERAPGKEITISDLVFTVAPRINAAGRIEHGKKAVEILLSREHLKAQDAGELINQTNNRRRDLDKTITAEALEIIQSNSAFLNARSSVLFKPDWHKGVVGIVASRVMEKFYRPTIVLTLSDGMITGSARTIKDFDILEALNLCSDLLFQYGGHRHAAGLTLKPENLDAFRDRFENIAKEKLTDEQLQEVIELDMEIEPDQITRGFYNILKQFAPFGPGNPAPVFLTRQVMDDGTGRIVGNNHLKMRLGKPGKSFFDAIGFGLGDFHTGVNRQIPVDACYIIEENHWNGNVNLQWQIKDMRIG